MATIDTPPASKFKKRVSIFWKVAENKTSAEIVGC